MKLCIVTHSLLRGDGQGRVNYEVAWGAIHQGYTVTLVASHVAPELQQHSQVTWIPIPVDRYQSDLLKELAFSRQSATWLHHHRTEFDLIKANGAITSANVDVNAVHFMHYSWLQSPAHTFRVRRDLYGAYQWGYTALNAYWEKRALQRTRIVVAVSKRIAKELMAIGVPPERIRTIANGVDTQEFSPGTVDRSQWNLPKETPLALFAGDIQTPRKNLDTVLHALTYVPELHLAVAGKTEGSPYPQLATKLGVASRVHFLGYRRDLPELMRASDLFVFPSRYEACSLVLLEAMASGLPILTAVTTGGAELVTPECGIILSDPDDVQALASALTTLSNNFQRRQEMRVAARAVAEQCSWQKMTEQYMDLFEELNCK